MLSLKKLKSLQLLLKKKDWLNLRRHKKKLKRNLIKKKPKE